MYTQQMKGQSSVNLAKRNGGLQSTVRPFTGRSVTSRSVRSAKQRSTLRPNAILEKLGIGSDTSKGTAGIDYKPQDNSNAVQTDIIKKLAYVIGANANSATDREAYQGVAFSLRERLIERFNKTQEHWRYHYCPSN